MAEAEALHLAHLMAAHGYFFPVEDHVLTVKNDGTLYRFQVSILFLFFLWGLLFVCFISQAIHPINFIKPVPIVNSLYLFSHFLHLLSLGSDW